MQIADNRASTKTRDGVRTVTGRHRLFARTRRLVGALGVVLVVLVISSCDKPESAVAPKQKPETSSRVQEVAINGETFYERDFGDARFRLPEKEWNATFQLSSFTLFLAWPGPEVVKGYGQPDLHHFIHLVISESSEPIKTSSRERMESTIRVGNYAGPTLNVSLGLLEYARSAPARAIYLSSDENYRGPDGERPHVQCSPTPTSGWGGTRECRVDQLLSPRISYYYKFSDALLPAWPSIDEGIRKFLMSRLLREQ